MRGAAVAALRRLARGIALACLLTGAQAADVPLGFEDATLQGRFDALLAELRCLVCQNQSLADSHADLAQDLRNEVYRLLERGASDDEVRAFMVERYGDFVLYEPPVRSTTILLWVGPAVFVVVAAAVMLRLARRRNAAPATLSAEERARLDALLGEARRHDS